MIIIWRLCIITAGYYSKITRWDTGKGGEYGCVFTIVIDGVFYGF